jgi:D-alanyl-D-alanine carboxypeptidase
MKFLAILLSIIFLFAKQSHAAKEGCSKVYSSLVFEESSGDILSQTRSDEIAYPASLVKLMTIYLTFDALEKHKINASDSLTISERGEEIGSVNKNNSLHLKKGDKITVHEAILAVIVKSFNEAAVTLAEAVSGDEWSFVREMNAQAQKLGMINTSFRNASGLHEEGQYTTSYDLARLAIAIKRDFPEYYHIFSSKKFTYHGTVYETHNHVLVDYKGAEGMKTGFTNASGFNLITSAKKGDKRIVSVLLGCASYQKRDQLTKDLLNEAFDDLSNKKNHEIRMRLEKNFDYKNNKTEKENNHEDEIKSGMVLFGEAF